MEDNAYDLEKLQEAFEVHILNGVRTSDKSFSHQTMNEAERLATSLNLYFNNKNEEFAMYEGPTNHIARRISPRSSTEITFY